MVVEIRGAQFVNKGAELMLLTVVQEINNRFPDTKFAVEPQKKIPYNKRIKYQIYAIPRIRKFGINFTYLIHLIPQKLRKQLGLFIEDEVDAIIDISGFAYGDYWGIKTLKNNLTTHIKRWNNKKIKLLLLPQAFGPFEKKGMSKEFKKVIKFSDFISARDIISYKTVLKLNDYNKNIYKFPDITLNLKPICSSQKKYENYILIIPNSKMLFDKYYIPYLKKLSLHLLNIDENFAFLIHEGESDFEIAKKVCSEINENIDIIYIKDALEIKSLIGRSKLVITSRFHGLVNSLSQGVPCLATSWSHKYEMLLQEYNYKDGLIGDLKNFNTTETKLTMVLENYNEIKEKIKLHVKVQETELNKMWDNIFDILKS